MCIRRRRVGCAYVCSSMYVCCASHIVKYECRTYDTVGQDFTIILYPHVSYIYITALAMHTNMHAYV